MFALGDHPPSGPVNDGRMTDETRTSGGRTADQAHWAARARSFNDAAGLYSANRPSYPPALFDALEEVTGIGLGGARVADVGAGTGIASRLLAARGARVVAVEPGAGMAAEFRRALPGVPVVRGDGNALPLAGASVDLLTYAQSWHWTDPARSVPEALRVLRPGGALALWWNTTPDDVPWIAAQQRRLIERLGKGARAGGRPDDATARQVSGLGGLPMTRREFRWSRVVPIGVHLANLASHSALLTAGPAGADFLEDERALLAAEFPGGEVEEVYVVDLLVATRPA
jgi:SAM-dependent methyltransferase